jgi:hypothetical protein
METNFIFHLQNTNNLECILINEDKRAFKFIFKMVLPFIKYYLFAMLKYVLSFCLVHTHVHMSTHTQVYMAIIFIPVFQSNSLSIYFLLC